MTTETRGHVLIVDDDPAMRQVIAETLREEGFSVRSAATGEEALALIEAREPEAVVADVEMPGMTGLELCRRVRSSGRDSIPFLFFSGLGSSDSRVEGLAAGADDYLVKPVRSDELVLKLARQVERVRRLRAAARPAVDAKALRALESRLRAGAPLVPLGRFEVRGILGHGSMGTVFKAWDTKLERWVAIKTVRADSAVAELWDDVVRNLVAEAAIVARFNHPHVVHVYDVHDEADAAYIVMELVAGASLEDLLRLGALPPERAVPLLAALAGALAAAHAANVLHRDVKPGNVLLGDEGAVKLTDFGIASFTPSRTRHTLFGTPGFVPPETLRGNGFDRAGDLFALGAVAYRCLTGRRAFEGATVKEILAATMNSRVRPPRESHPQTPPEVDALVTALLEPDPASRLADAAAVAAELGRVAGRQGWAWTAPDLAAARAAATSVAEGAHAQVVPTLRSDDELQD